MTTVDAGRLPIADARSVTSEIRSALHGQGGRLTAVVTTMIVGAALGLVPPWALGRMVDTVVDGGGSGGIWQLGGIVVAAALGFAGFTALGVVLSSRLFETVLARLRERMFRAGLALPLERVEKAGTGDLVSRASDDVEEVSNAVNTVVPALSTSLFTVLLTAAGLTALDWRFLGALASIVPVYVLAVRWYLRNAPGIYAAERAAMGQRAQHVLGAVRGLRTVHAYDMSPHLARRVGQHSWEVVRWTMRARIVQNRFYGRLEFAQFLGMASLLVIGFHLVGADASTVGATTTAMLFFLRLFEPIENLLLVIDELQSALASLARIVGVIHTQQPKAAGPELPSGGALEARGITFGYTPNRPVLRGVDIAIQPCETVALVGTSGAGKSSLAAVLAGVRSPNEGQVRFGSIDLADSDDSTRAQHITLVTQEVHMFAGTLRDDLAMAAPDAADDTMVAALRTVHAGDWFDLLPDGLDTIVGDAGRRLTPVQVQQVALARVLLVDPPMVILDEATAHSGSADASSADAGSADAGSAGASLLESAAEEVITGRGALIVAHRLSQARNADRIVLMDNGRIVEEGSHEHLVAIDGRYAQLWSAWSANR